MKKKTLPVNKVMCATCPFREGSRYAFLVPELEAASLQSSRICHSTGPNNAINTNTGKPARLCRGSRNYQIRVLYEMGFLAEASDECWDRKWRAMNESTNKRE